MPPALRRHSSPRSASSEAQDLQAPRAPPIPCPDWPRQLLLSPHSSQAVKQSSTQTSVPSSKAPQSKRARLDLPLPLSPPTHTHISPWPLLSYNWFQDLHPAAATNTSPTAF
ncbi:hypothetical protein BDZ91DRAFT_731244 [Kalaharituber pfeilii]|nr:hypothetical protein BDZ91DRAFT_731244 [Kalaharituber pfeilii]